MNDPQEHAGEYVNGDDDVSETTTLSFEQWEQRNADILNGDEYGVGLENDLDIDDDQLFDESSILKAAVTLFSGILAC
eukprot:5554343-Amphidinium_carterae.1